MSDLPSVLHQICERHDLPWVEPTRFPQGSGPVFALDQLVIKLFSPQYRQDWQLEGQFLRHLQDHPSIPTPALIAMGEIGDELYVADLGSIWWAF